MQILIPMAGSGRRFVDAGFREPKPLVAVDGKPMIERVVRLFPGESNFSFICSSRHLRDSAMKEVLRSAAPGGRVFAIAPHRLGPVHSVLAIADQIDDEDEAIVNYCDFSKTWDYAQFLEYARGADGAVSAYRGFHPHMLGGPKYAFIRCEGGWLSEISEKRAFTDRPMEEYASDGTYYFRRGAYVKRFFRELVEKNIQIEGEYYASMAYNLMRQAGLKTRVYEIRRMLQWGTPEDLAEYHRQSSFFRLAKTRRENAAPLRGSINLVAMAGAGRRLRDAGYRDPKPLVPVAGKAMFRRAIEGLPRAEKDIFVCLARDLNAHPMEKEILAARPGAKIVALAAPAAGEALSCAKALEGEDPASPLLIAACDNIAFWEARRYQALVEDEKISAIVWAFRGCSLAAAHPEMYGWLRVDSEGRVTKVSVKRPVSREPLKDYAVTGTFFFRRAGLFSSALSRLRERGAQVGGECYVDGVMAEMVDSGLDVRVLEVDGYAGWGTPDELKTFEYWNEHFGAAAA